MITSPKNFIEQFQNFIEHIAGVMKTFLTKEKADNYYLGKSEKASSASLADTATKATQDANGNVIPETYATKSELTSGLATKQPAGDYRTKSELDSIYLGINAKAKSAVTADIATKVAISGIIGSRKVSLNGSLVQVSLISSGDLKTWTVPSDGVLHTTYLASDATDYVKHNDVLLPSYHTNINEENEIDRPALPIPVYKDDTFTVKGRTTRHKAALEGWFFPYKTIEVTENE